MRNLTILVSDDPTVILKLKDCFNLEKVPKTWEAPQSKIIESNGKVFMTVISLANFSCLEDGRFSHPASREAILIWHSAGGEKSVKQSITEHVDILAWLKSYEN